MKTYLLACVVVVFLLVLQGCATPETQLIEDQADSLRIPFIRDGMVSRREIMGRFGPPASTYENGRIITYWMIENDEGALEVITKNATAIDLQRWRTRRNGQSTTGYHNLVLVFGEDDVLERHSLVFIR